ncbi:MAG: beta-CASP ribonuclease aCPSF1 [Candidatus Bathyarchaeia archaeon]
MKGQSADPLVRIRETILDRVPKEAEITRVNFEGSRLVIYAKKPELLLFGRSYVIPSIVSLIRKRIVVRSDPSIRSPEKETELVIREVIPKEAEVNNIVFDPTIGEVIIEAKKVGLAVGKEGSNLQEIMKRTKWSPRVIRTPPIPSKIIANQRHIVYTESRERERIQRAMGERIFRNPVLKAGEITVTALGGFKEVGRSSLLVSTKESKILIDCGINPGVTRAPGLFPYLGELDLEELDAVVISHGHLDHCGSLPMLFKYGFDGAVYCSEPTSSLMTLAQLDFLDVASKEGITPPYDQKDVREVVLHTFPLKYGFVLDIAPEVKLTLWNAGHILGSSIVHLHIGEGLHNIVFTGDFKYGKTQLLDPSIASFTRVETLIIESTYGGPEDVMPPRAEVEKRFVELLNSALQRGGKVLIPVPAIGRSQEIMIVLDEYMKRKELLEVPVYVEGMINEATAIHTAYPEYLSRELRDKILYEDVNPFQSDYFTILSGPTDREQIVEEGGPCIIIATSGMLEGGPAVEYFKLMAQNPNNLLVFVSYQIEGTLGRRLKNGLGEVALADTNGRIQVYSVKMEVKSVEGFSGHSDRAQILNYLKRISPKPEKVIVCHGEPNKVLNLSQAIWRSSRIPTFAPDNLETVRLR